MIHGNLRLGSTPGSNDVKLTRGKAGQRSFSKEEMFPCVGLNCSAMKWDNWTENLKYNHNQTRMTSLINKNIFWLAHQGHMGDRIAENYRMKRQKGYISITWLKFHTKSVTAVLEQYLSTTAQPIQEQMCAENYKILFQTDETSLLCLIFPFFPYAAERDDGGPKWDGPNICTRIPQSM